MNKNKTVSINELIKKEIIKQIYNQEQFEIILIYYLRNNLIFKHDKTKKQPYLQLSSHFKPVINFLKEKLKNFYQIETELVYGKSKNSIHVLKIFNAKNYEFLNLLITKDVTENLKLFLNNYFSYAMIGAFLANGVICNFEDGIYHCEINFATIEDTKLFSKCLNKIKIANNIFGNKYKIYIKKIDAISDLLKLIHAPEMMLLLEECKINKDQAIQTNRLNNLEVANISKSVSAGILQQKMIQDLLDHNKLDKINYKFNLFIKIRLENADISLSRMAEIFQTKYDVHISKSGLNHFIIKLKLMHQELLKSQS